MRRAVTLLAIVSSLLGASVARAQDGAASAGTTATSAQAPPSAPTKDQCADAYEQSQRLRKAYKLRAAHGQLLVCAAATCPGFMKQDCAKWLGEVESSTPTVVLLARDADGTALVDVRVTMDGQPLSDHLDGRAIAVDPGAHQMRYEAGGRVVDQRVVVAEGARNQPIVADFGPPPAPAGAETPAPSPSPLPSPSSSPSPSPSPSEASHGVPTATWVLGGVAVAGALSFAGFAIAGRSEQSCSPDCTRPQVDALRRDYLVADVSWITGLVAAGAALVVYLVAPSAPAAPTAAALRW